MGIIYSLTYILYKDIQENNKKHFIIHSKNINKYKNS